jgi:hypothetical protein
MTTTIVAARAVVGAGDTAAGSAIRKDAPRRLVADGRTVAEIAVATPR